MCYSPRTLHASPLKYTYKPSLSQCLVVLIDDQLLYVLHNPLVPRTQVLTYLMLPNLVSRVCSIDRPYRCAEQCDKVPYKGVRVPVSLDPVFIQ